MSDFVELNILGHHFRLNCPTDKVEQLQKTAKEFETFVSTLKTKSGIVQLELALILAGINIYNELSTKKQNEKEFHEKLTAILKIVEQNTITQDETLY